MGWASFAGSGAHNWLVVLAILLLGALWLRAVMIDAAENEPPAELPAAPIGTSPGA